MKHLIVSIILSTIMISNISFAAKKPASVSSAKTSVAKSEKKSLEKKADKRTPQAEAKKKKKTKKSKKKKVAEWNDACQGLLDNSVSSTLKLEKAVQKKKKISKEEFDNKIQNELLVVQLNAWVCAVSTSSEKSASAVEEKFFQDYSKQVQSKQL